MTIYKLRCRTCFVTWNYSKELRERGKGKENDRASVMPYNIRCEGRTYRVVY
jgi:hypothetical protein